MLQKLKPASAMSEATATEQVFDSQYSPSKAKPGTRGAMPRTRYSTQALTLEAGEHEMHIVQGLQVR